ncbi:MAG: type II toxin-antitoxin system MqsA family antitoxin [Pseudomonadota bacterium]
MKCAICRTGETHEGVANVTLARGKTTVFIKDVPAQVCDNCGEYYLSSEISDRVLALAEIAVQNNAEFEILRFAA